MTATPKILLVPVDGSKGSNGAAQYAAGLAAAMNIPVRLLFAFPASAMDMFGVPSEVMGREDLRYFSPEVFEELRERSASGAFESAKKAIGESGVAIENELLTGDAAEAIVDHANTLSDAMIVMGSRGLSRVKGILVGSVSQRVLEHARCPVLIAR